jgi:hypothetical protein
MKKTPTEQLLAVTSADSDRRVAMIIADKLLWFTDPPFRFQINHDVRPPKCLPCPMRYDWIVKDHVGVEFKNKEVARKWLTTALLHGYKVEKVDGHRKPTNNRTESVDK